MTALTGYPIAVFVVTLLVLSISTRVGAAIARRQRGLDEHTREDFGVVQSATLTLLGLIIGFSFSMAISRHDQRKQLEAEEANAIGTEYLRADLLPSADAAKVRGLLRRYIDQRILFYTIRDAQRLALIDTDTAALQADLWSAIRAAAANPTPVVALAVAGMNDVLNSQAYTLAAWGNRIPSSAWGLMAAIAIAGNLLMGYGARRAEAESMLLLVLPVLVAVAFLLIADLDSPRGGLIRVAPQNLRSLAQSLRGQ